VKKQSSNNNGKFFIFSQGIIWNDFKKHNEEFHVFCKKIGDECFGTLFMPEDRDEFCRTTSSAIIQLWFPGVIRYADVNGKVISSNFIEEAINLRKVQVSKAVVIAATEKDFVDFDWEDNKLEFVILDRSRAIGEYNSNNIPYRVIHSLVEAVDILNG